MKKQVSIWNINSFAEFFMQIYPNYRDDYKKACDQFIQAREDFEKELREIPFIHVMPSQANYFLCEVIDKFTASELTELLLNRYNILIKDCNTKTALQGRNFIRISVRNRHDNDQLVEALLQIKDNA
jgi:histidinol-phosphate/aromatic aminotransferase/cobyric acid decarboxylase-like protein